MIFEAKWAFLAPAAPSPALLVDNIVPREIRDRIDCSIPMGRGHKNKEPCHRPARQRCAPVQEIIENTSYGIENFGFFDFFRLSPGRSPQCDAGPARYYTPRTGTRRAPEPGRAARPPPRPTEDNEFKDHFSGVEGAFRFHLRQSKWGQLEGVGDLVFLMKFESKFM